VPAHPKGQNAWAPREAYTFHNNFVRRTFLGLPSFCHRGRRMGARWADLILPFQWAGTSRTHLDALL